jgi:hypothetical protein
MISPTIFTPYPLKGVYEKVLFRACLSAGRDLGAKKKGAISITSLSILPESTSFYLAFKVK